MLNMRQIAKGAIFFVFFLRQTPNIIMLISFLGEMKKLMKVTKKKKFKKIQPCISVRFTKHIHICISFMALVELI